MMPVLRCRAGLFALVLATVLPAQNPPAPEELDFKDGVARIPDRATYKKLSYQGPDVAIDVGLRGIEYVKYQIEKLDTDKPQLYFINTVTHRSHPGFMRAIGIGGGPGGRGGFGPPGFGPPGGFGGRGGGGPVERMRGVLAFRPLLMAPNGSAGLYTIEYEPNDAYEYAMVKKSIDMLVEKAPFLAGKIGYYPIGRRAEAQYEEDKELYAKANIPAFFPRDAYKNISFLPLNVAAGFGRLRVMQEGRPGPRDVVLYKTLPNEMPRVGGVITEIRQTPLSHVNLRAVQDRVPNAFIENASAHPQIAPLIGKYVRFAVAGDGFEIREATAAEVEKHFAALRPAAPQVPVRDLEVKAIRALDDIGFADARSVGVKAANIAAMRELGFPEGTVPAGFAVPFSFYHAFMEHNGLYDKARKMQEEPGFATDADVRTKALKKLRKAIKTAEMPDWMASALDAMHKRFPAGTAVRCRSSTNNEDLPGFSGAGLYDSFTHKPSEGHIAKTIRQVFASLWNFRAYEEREFYRIDHFAAAMGVLCHPNFKGETANGVAVSSDIVYQSGNNYYVNVQVGEDLVTNPDAASSPEELLLSPSDPQDDKVVQRSTRTRDGAPILSREHCDQLRRMLGRIKRKFRTLYGHKRSQGPFAMEIEFKVTKAGKLAIKQARPWVF